MQLQKKITSRYEKKHYTVRSTKSANAQKNKDRAKYYKKNSAKPSLYLHLGGKLYHKNCADANIWFDDSGSVKFSQEHISNFTQTYIRTRLNFRKLNTNFFYNFKIKIKLKENYEKNSKKKFHRLNLITLK